MLTVHLSIVPCLSFSTLRQASAEYLSSLPFDGFAVGGALGKDREELKEVLRVTMPQ